MSEDEGEHGRWICGGSGMVNLQRVSSLVRDISEPCLNPSPAKGSKMLKPEKWHATFDGDGKVRGFRKVLKLIIVGGIDPSIRSEVWEFLLGCYDLDSTLEYRNKLRMARREKYRQLIAECQMMHSSIGTGQLAYAVGSRLMDVRTMSRNDNVAEEASTSQQVSHVKSKNWTDNSKPSNGSAAVSRSRRHKSFSKLDEPVVSDGLSNSPFLTFSSDYNEPKFDQPKFDDEPKYDPEPYIDFALPLTNLFSRGDEGSDAVEKCDYDFSVPEDRIRYRDVHMHSFQITNNVDLIMETNVSYNELFRSSNSDSAIFQSDAYKNGGWLSDSFYNRELVGSLRISDAPDVDMINEIKSNDSVSKRDTVSEWLWTLHRIVVDVVRTDSHMDFYSDTKNMARMSDILAVYAWVDPSTGYCQGMSDLLSPFVVLYEDDADAFWCFEMLLRRMRDNFQMEGPTGVMKQLQALLKIVELSDAELFGHLSVIGAESLHFAFRMLLVLFRRELSFDEALCMWEMMWAADFDEDFNKQLEQSCLEPLLLEMTADPLIESNPDGAVSSKRKSKSMLSRSRNGRRRGPYVNGLKSSGRNPLCGLSTARIWARKQQLEFYSTNILAKNGDDDMPVFCVAAILIINRQKIMRETQSIDDAIKMFNDNLLKIKVKRCIRLAIKLRKKYFYKIMKGSLDLEQ